MSEKDLTQIAYLIQSLVRQKASAQKILNAVTEVNGELSAEVQQVLNVLIHEMGSSVLDEKALRAIAGRLLKANDPVKKNAGRAAAWALETA
ncbi:MAG: hypothetical protein QM723_18340 [Myxococcaceae bacterium]